MNLTYHGVPRRYFESLDPTQPYTPPEFLEDGFIHCTDGRQAVSIILTLIYERNPEPFLILTIDKDRVTAPIKYEDPARIYPHIYGPLNRDAILAVAPVERSSDGTFHMPPVPWSLRDAVESDYPHMVEIVNRYRFTPTNLAEFQRNVEQLRQRKQYRRLAAVDMAGQVLGYGTVFTSPWNHAHVRWVGLYVHPLAQRQGVGRALLTALELQAREWGATSLYVEVRDDLPGSLRFAQACGYGVADRGYPSRLDLERFDPAPFLGAVQRAEEQGYRFISLADVEPEEGARKLFDMDMLTSVDEPGLAEDGLPTEITYEQYLHDTVQTPAFDPRGVIVALKDGEWVAYTGLHFPPEKTEAQVFYTCVVREHRGKGLAQAVKVLACQYAMARGYTHITTGNNERNAAMLAVNRKFGFVPGPGMYRLKKEL